MEIVYTALLALCAFWLGACPFSVLIGRWLLGKDITEYGDGNPGAINVFRAGGRKLGYLAILLDVAKGIPFIYLAHSFFGLSELAVVVVGLCAVLGHAFSPFLQWRGGKAIAVTFGVLIALPQHEILFAFAIFVILCFLFVENHSWVVIFGTTGTLAYLAVTKGSSWELLLMLCILVIFVFKHFEGLRAFPGTRGILVRWLQGVIRGTSSII